MHSRDRAAIRAILANGFESVDVQGKATDADTMIEQALAVPDDPNRKAQTTVLAVRIEGSDAFVKQHYSMTTTRTGPGAIAHVVELDTFSDDVWTKSNSAWVLKQTTTLTVSLKRDGQVVWNKAK